SNPQLNAPATPESIMNAISSLETDLDLGPVSSSGQKP
ncbi:MAG: hypothetical protein ACI88H_002985, partial [Cocleimonas sp.]